jgi:hypothetical protein
MELVWSWNPIYPYHIGVGICFVILFGLLILGLPLGRWRNLSQNFAVATVLAFVSFLAGLFLFIASLNPSEVTQPETQEHHLSVVVDVSLSVTRNPDWRESYADVATLVDNSLFQLPDIISRESPASLVIAGNNSTLIPATLESIADEIRQVDPSNVNVDGTNLEDALKVSANAIENSTGRGEILLVTDGHETNGSAQTVLPFLSQRGYPVTVIPLSAGSTTLALSAVNLPEQTQSEIDTNLRLVIENDAPVDQNINFSFWKNPVLQDVDSLFGEPQQADVSASVQAGGYAHATQEIRFGGVGLQFMDVVLYDEDGQTSGHRRVYTNVIRPLKILAYGDSAWQRGLSPDIAEVEFVADTATLDTIDLSQYDSVVFGGVRADQFSTLALERLASAVSDDGLGLMFLNGSHAPALEEAETILRSYRETAIDPILPVSAEPRKICPPPRHVVILIDTSGSMSGGRLDQAKQIATHIVTLMQEGDVLNVRGFTTGQMVIADIKARECSEVQLSEEEILAADEQWRIEQTEAIVGINQLQPGGGTDPTSALATLTQERIDNCGLFFISDGGFSTPLRARPDCRVYAFGIGGIGALPTIANEATDIFPVDANFNPASINFEFLEEQEQNKFFEFGDYIPSSLAIVGEEALYIPPLNMTGAAVSYIREDAELIAVRPRLIDPLLAYRAEGAGLVGYIGTRIPDTWADSPEGRKAIEEWILRTIGYYARDRYVFTVKDNGRALVMTIEVRNQNGTLPDVGSLAVDIETPNGRFTSRVQEIGKATFEAELDITRIDKAQVATLIIEEGGNINTILPRQQRIPILIPAQANLIDTASSSEDNSVGTRETLLHDIAEVTGGTYNPPSDYTFFESDVQARVIREYWQIFLTLGAGMFIFAIFIRRFGR